MRRLFCLAILLLTLGAATSAPAQTAPRKFLRGLAGMTTAFLEVPGNMVAETDARGPAEGIPLGFARGLGMIIPRVLVGVWEFLSAPFPVPSGYRRILEPEFPWSYFEDRGHGPSSRPGKHK
jgi:putative exosortase-associated protein (TIGR04073 family)